MQQPQVQVQVQQPVGLSVPPVTVQLQSPVIQQNWRDWTHGSFSCFDDMGECCFAFWCPPCHWCRLASRMDEYYCGPNPPPCGCSDVFRVAMRTKLRTMLGIRGTICEDTICVVFCPCCTAIQMGQELKYHRLT